MPLDHCDTCSADASLFVDDVVTGDTVCTQCGTVCNMSAGLLMDAYPDRCDNRTNRDGRYGDICSVCSLNYDESTVNTITTVTNYANDPDSRYGDILKALSRLTPDIDRRSRIVMQRACGRAIERHPALGFKRPESLVIAIFVLHVHSDRKGYNRTRTIASDPTITAMCQLLNAKPSSIAAVLRVLEQ